MATRLGKYDCTVWQHEGCKASCSEEELWDAAEFIRSQESSGVSGDNEEEEERHFGEKRPDRVAIETSRKALFLLEFKKSMDLGTSFEMQAKERARKQYDSMIKALQLVGESKGWSVHLVTIVGGTLGSVNKAKLEEILKCMDVRKDAWDQIRRNHARRLLDGQEEVLRAYYGGLYNATRLHGDRHLGRIRRFHSEASLLSQILH